MIKKTILIFVTLGMLFSCGKKGDPIYVDPDGKVEKSIIFSVKIS
tara:strand:+ start:302 stop:436 length:135 start_codon:yes stop_codon:yes gene_type:complete